MRILRELMDNHVVIWLEVVYIVMCIHLLYGRKFRLNNRKNIGIILLEILLLEMHEYIPCTHVIVHILFFLYVGIEFGFEKKKLITNVVLNLIIVAMLEMGVFITVQSFCTLFLSKWVSEISYFVYNICTFLIVLLLFPRLRLDRFSDFIQHGVGLLRIIFFVAFICIAYLLLQFWTTNFLLPEQYLVIVISLFLLGGVIYMWQESHYKLREQELELQMHQMYDEGFQNLITEIRKRQHDFQNHLNTIYSMHYTCTTYEELVKQQQVYAEAIQQENRYHKLLKIGNPVIIGFLYGKFLQAEKCNITISYDIRIGDLQSRMPIHKMVEVIGNLFDNAVEAIEDSERENVIYLEFTENQEHIEFKIKNESEYISQDERIKMFEKGKSSKGEHRGFGLANVKQICEQYKCDLQVRNQKEEEKVYLEFQINIKSKKRNEKRKK